MDDQDLAAVSAADEVVTPAEDVSSETEKLDGQDAPAPAADDAAAEEKTRSQQRREARKEADRRRAEEKAKADKELAAANARLELSLIHI